MTRKGTALVLMNGECKSEKTLRYFWESSALKVCTDGAAGTLAEYGLQPDMILGDMDSIAPEVKSFFGDVPILEIPDQSTTDGEKALQYCLDNGYKTVVIMGALGKRLDHSLYNIALLKQFFSLGMSIKMLNEKETVEIIQQETKISGYPGLRISLLPVFGPAEGVTTEGLKFPLAGEKMAVGGLCSISNVMTGSTAVITIEKGELLLITNQVVLDEKDLPDLAG